MSAHSHPLVFVTIHRCLKWLKTLSPLKQRNVYNKNVVRSGIIRGGLYEKQGGEKKNILWDRLATYLGSKAWQRGGSGNHYTRHRKDTRQVRETTSCC